MTGIAHLSTGLLLKTRFKSAPVMLLVIAGGATDLIWVTLNLVRRGILPPLEIATIDLPFLYIGNMHLEFQAYSHSLTGCLIQGLFFGILLWIILGDARIIPAIMLAVFGHWFLDFLVHDADLTLLPFDTAARVGPPISLNAAKPTLGLYSLHPIIGFLFQTMVVGICAWIFLRAYPPESRKKYYIFGGIMIVPILAALPTFWSGAMTAMVSDVTKLVGGVLVDAGVAGAAIYLALRFTNRDVLKTEIAPATLESGVLRAAAMVAVICSLLYALQGFLSPSPIGIGGWTWMFAILYMALAGALFLVPGAMKLVLRTAVLIPVVGGTLIRLFVGPGQLGIPILALETLLVSLAVWRLYLARSE